MRTALRFLRWPKFLALTLITALLAACGQTPAETPGASLQLSTLDTEVVRGSQAQIEVSLLLSGGASGDFVLSVSGLPAEVDATFSSTTLSGSQLSGTLTLAAEPAAVDGEHQLSVTASGESLSAEAELMLEVVSLTVDGQAMATPVVPRMGIEVSSQGSEAITDEDGRFTLTGLSVPYDLTTVDQTTDYVHVYAGLTTPTPRVSGMDGVVLPSTDRSSDVMGDLTGDLLPLESGEKLIVCVEPLDWISGVCATVEGASTSYSLSPSWAGPATMPARLHALKMTVDLGGKPTGYSSYSVHDLLLTHELTTTQDLEPGEPVGSKTMLLEVESSSTALQTLVGVEVGDNLTIPLLQDSDGSKALAVILPDLPNVTYTAIHVSNLLSAAWASGLTGEPVKLVVPDEPTTTEPANGATGVSTSTAFTVAGWTGPITHVWTPNSPTGPRIALTSMASTVTIPDTTELGLPLPAAASYNWQIISRTGTSVEAGLTPMHDFMNIFMVLFGMPTGLEGEGGFVMGTTSVNFTTVP